MAKSKGRCRRGPGRPPGMTLADELFTAQDEVNRLRRELDVLNKTEKDEKA